MSSIELRAADGPGTGRARLGFGADSTILLAPEWRSLPDRVEVELVSGEAVAGSRSTAGLEPIRVKPEDRPSRSGVVILRVSADGEAPVPRAFWQRGFERERGRSGTKEKSPLSDTGVPAAWYRNGAALRAQGDVAAALESFKKAAAMDPDDARNWNMVGETLADLGHHDEAVKAFDQALALRPRFTTASGNKALALAATGRREASRAALAYLLAADPESTARILWKAQVLERLGDHEEAVGAYREYARLEPKRPDAWFRLGHALLRLQRFQDAVEAFDEALALDPGHDRAALERRASLNVLERRED
jgi:tetratricopeptide (TPR) repeat protein